MIKRLPKRNWPIRPLELMGFGKLKDFFDPELVDTWRKKGLSDSEADMVAISFHSHAMLIWTGWLEAGFDNLKRGDDV